MALAELPSPTSTVSAIFDIAQVWFDAYWPWAKAGLGIFAIIVIINFLIEIIKEGLHMLYLRLSPTARYNEARSEAIERIHLKREIDNDFNIWKKSQ